MKKRQYEVSADLRRILKLEAGTHPAVTPEAEITHVDGLRAVTAEDLARLDPLGVFRESLVEDMEIAELEVGDTEPMAIDPEAKFIVTELGRQALERAKREGGSR